MSNTDGFPYPATFRSFHQIAIPTASFRLAMWAAHVESNPISVRLWTMVFSYGVIFRKIIVVMIMRAWPMARLTCSTASIRPSPSVWERENGCLRQHLPAHYQHHLKNHHRAHSLEPLPPLSRKPR
jgi:hypothetical protein